MRMTRSLVWVAIVLLVAYLLFVGGAWSGIYSATIRLTSLSLAATVLGSWTLIAIRRPDWRPRSVMLPAILACTASLAISTAFSLSPRVSLDYLVYGVTLAALYLLLVRLMADAFFRARLLVFARVAFIAISAAFIALCIAHWSTWWIALGRLAIPPLRPEYESLTFGSPQGVLTMVALLGVSVASTVDWQTQRGRTALASVAILIGAVGLLSGSRGAWFALGLAGLAAAGWLAISQGRAVVAGIARQLSSTRGRAIIGGAGLVLVLAAVVIGPGIVGRITAGGEASRLTFAATALRLFAEHSITGAGPGAWVIERPRLTLAGEVDDYQPHAHDLYAQTLAELGIVGLVAGGVLIASVAWLLRNGLGSGDARRRRWAAATTIGAVYFLAHQVVDFWADMPALLFAAALPIAYLDATATGSPPTARLTVPSPVRRVAWAAFAAVIAIGLGWSGARELDASRYEALVSAANQGDWANAAAIDEIAEHDPSISVYGLAAALALDRQGEHAQAADLFRIVALSDDLPEAWLDLAAEQVALGDAAGARESLTRAGRLGVQRPAVAMAIGDLGLQLGDATLARAAFAAAIAAEPSLAADPWWSADPDRSSTFAAVVASLTTPEQPRGWEVALMLDDGDTALALAADAPAGTSDFIRAWLGDDTAAASLTGRCRANPFDIPALQLCARIAYRNGDEDAAFDFRYLANAQIQESFLGGFEVRIALAADEGYARAGNLASAWGTYTYRRPTPDDLLVPSLVHLEVQ